MSKKRTTNTRSGRPANGRPLPKSNTNATIQMIAGAVILLALAAIGYAIFMSQGGSLGGQNDGQQAAALPTEGPTPEQVAPKQYASAPPRVIEEGKDYTATVRMENGGEFVIQLYPDKAPLTVNSFVFLAREGYFDGVTFHRVLEGFMAQGGDPTGTGGGGPGYQIVNEDSDLSFDKAGVVAMANAGRDTNGSQFFITYGPTPHLDGGYTIFGQVIEGMEVVEGLRLRNPEQFPDYTGDVMQSVTINEE